MLILLSTVYGSFHATTAKLHSCNEDLWPAKLKTYFKNTWPMAENILQPPTLKEMG